MNLHFNTMKLITICIIFSTAYTDSKEDCIELITNDTKSALNQNKFNRSTKKLVENITITTQQQSEGLLQSNEDAGKYLPLIHFLTKATDLSILNIPYNNNENGIDILKAATHFKADNKKQKDIKEIDIEDSVPSTTSVNTIAKNIENITTGANVSAKNNFPKDTGLPVLSSFYTNNGNAIEILKSFSSLTEADTKTRKYNKNDSKEVEVEHQESFVAFSNTTNSANKNLNKTLNIDTTTAKHLPADEIVLSELINMSVSDEGDLTTGQKIELQDSNITSAIVETNSVGADILNNISHICGSLFGKRISFANETTLMEFPWTVLLLYNTQIRYHCGGSLITRKYVLTAAHCVAQQFYELVGVRLGEHDISEAVDCAPDLAGDTICATTIDANVVKIIVHHEYSHLSFKNDIALLRLDKDYINRSYYPICLPTPEMMYNGRQATVAGWGATEKAIRSSILLKADVPLHDISQCREIYRYSVFNDSTEICGSGANEVDVCKGDSGGALFYNQYVKGKDKFYQLGIISLGVRRCGDSRFFPAVFTKINGFYKWIENNLEY